MTNEAIYEESPAIANPIIAYKAIFDVPVELLMSEADVKSDLELELDAAEELIMFILLLYYILLLQFFIL
jgi:hypothetical protein